MSRTTGTESRLFAGGVRLSRAGDRGAKGVSPFNDRRAENGILRRIMPRTARITPGGMVFHVLNRGVGRQPRFGKHEEFEAFEEIVAETRDKYAMRI